MLKIHFGELADEIKVPSVYFDTDFEEDWFEDEFVKEMVLGVDKTIVSSAYQMASPVLGPINCRMLSGGVKNLILAYELDRPIDASFCGDNCAEWILKIAEKKDLTISLYNIMLFNCDFTALILNNHRYVRTNEEYLRAAARFL